MNETGKTIFKFVCLVSGVFIGLMIYEGYTVYRYNKKYSATKANGSTQKKAGCGCNNQ